MHIPLTFQLIIEKLFLFQSSSTLQSMSTNLPQHILFKNQHNLHDTMPHHSYFLHLTQLLHHISNTTNSISFSKPQQLIFLSLYSHHCRILPSLSHANNTPQSNSSVHHKLLLSSLTTCIPHRHLFSKAPLRPLIVLQAMLVLFEMRGCTLLFGVSSCHPPKTSV